MKILVLALIATILSCSKANISTANHQASLKVNSKQAELVRESGDGYTLHATLSMENRSTYALNELKIEATFHALYRDGYKSEHRIFHAVDPIDWFEHSIKSNQEFNLRLSSEYAFGFGDSAFDQTPQQIKIVTKIVYAGANRQKQSVIDTLDLMPAWKEVQKTLGLEIAHQ